MGGKCTPSGGIDIAGPDDISDSGTRILRNSKRGRQGRPNSRMNLYKNPQDPKQEELIASRWYDAEGAELHDRDYTNHGFPEDHADVHDHAYTKDKDGKTHRGKDQPPNGSC